MRRTLPAFAALVFLLVSSCGRPPRGRAENEILFTITQTSTSTDARYQFLTLSYEGQVREPYDDECYYEPLEERLGSLRVEDGVATWKTPLLPHDGLVVRANAAAPHLDHFAWRTGDLLSFDARGFAMPEPKPLSFAAPPAELDVLSPIAGEIGVSADRDLEVLWRPPDARIPSRVVVSFDSETDDRVICFFDATSGHGTVPGGLLHVLRARSRSKQGTLTFATHRQVDVPGPSGWFIYVVASHVARKQPFSLN